MPANPIIEIRNLSAGYDGRTVLHDVDLTVYERDFLGIIGPNGGGKTTLVKCILGLLKPTAVVQKHRRLRSSYVFSHLNVLVSSAYQVPSLPPCRTPAHRYTDIWPSPQIWSQRR